MGIELRLSINFCCLEKGYHQGALLSLPERYKPFELHTNAFDFVIGAVMMKEGHPIAFESQKLNDTEKRYMVQEKEMTTVVHGLRHGDISRLSASS